MVVSPKHFKMPETDTSQNPDDHSQGFNYGKSVLRPMLNVKEIHRCVMLRHAYTIVFPPDVSHHYFKFFAVPSMPDDTCLSAVCLFP